MRFRRCSAPGVWARYTALTTSDWTEWSQSKFYLAIFLPTAIVGCPTVREPDGLAFSSRNRRLGLPERRRAPQLYRTLRSASSADGAACELRASGFHVEYVEDRDGRRLAAVRLGDVRLIDNVALRTDDSHA